MGAYDLSSLKAYQSTKKDVKSAKAMMVLDEKVLEAQLNNNLKIPLRKPAELILSNPSDLFAIYAEGSLEQWVWVFICLNAKSNGRIRNSWSLDISKNDQYQIHQNPY